MATTAAAMKKMREICLALPDTTEDVHFGEVAFKVKKKLFASCGEKAGACRIVFGLAPDHARDLIAADARFQPYARDERGVVLHAADVDDWGEVAELIGASYRLVAGAASSKASKASKASSKKPARR